MRNLNHVITGFWSVLFIKGNWIAKYIFSTFSQKHFYLAVFWISQELSIVDYLGISLFQISKNILTKMLCVEHFKIAPVFDSWFLFFKINFLDWNCHSMTVWKAALNNIASLEIFLVHLWELNRYKKASQYIYNKLHPLVDFHNSIFRSFRIEMT